MDVNRRFVIKNAGIMGTVLLAPNLPMWAYSDEAPLQTAPPNFVGASSALVGVDASVLVPNWIQDDISLADSFYSVIHSGAPTAVSALMIRYANLVNQGQTPQQIANALLRSSNNQHQPGTADYSAAARLTMMMWLTGVWYGGTEIANLPGSASYIESGYQTDFVVSGRAYKNGWIWRFAQAHPMGFSHFQFGSWGSEPPSIDEYLNPMNESLVSR